MDKLAITIILTLAAYAGSIYGMNFKGIFHKIISFGLAVAMMLSWASVSLLSSISLIMVGILAIFTTIYGITIINLSFSQRVGISLIGFMMLAIILFKIQHWQGINILTLSLLVPVIFYLYSLIKTKITKELSFMIFWLVFSILQLFQLVQLNTIRLM